MTIHSSQGVTELLERWSEGDLGACWNFYPSKRIVTRFDAGDTMIRYGQRQTNFIGLDSVGNLTLVPFTPRAETRHNFQLSAGVGFRFLTRGSAGVLPVAAGMTAIHGGTIARGNRQDACAPLRISRCTH